MAAAAVLVHNPVTGFEITLPANASKEYKETLAEAGFIKGGLPRDEAPVDPEADTQEPETDPETTAPPAAPEADGKAQDSKK